MALDIGGAEKRTEVGRFRVAESAAKPEGDFCDRSIQLKRMRLRGKTRVELL